MDSSSKCVEVALQMQLRHEVATRMPDSATMSHRRRIVVNRAVAVVDSHIC